MTVQYIGVDGNTYTFELDESKVLESLGDLNTQSLGSGVQIFYDNNSDIPVSMPSGFGDGLSSGFDIRFQAVSNALTYIGNMSKAQTKEDFDRWANLYKGAVLDNVLYEINLLKREVERFQSDYGTLTLDISKALATVTAVAVTLKNTLSTFGSMAKLVAGISAFLSFIAPVTAIVGVIQLIDSNVKTALLPARQESLINQSNKVKALLDAYNNNDLYDKLNRFDTKVKMPTNSANLNSSLLDFISKYKYYIGVSIAVIFGYKFFKSHSYHA